jgi:predicted metal-dependent enzyme (double-stranded beta helix superfamily)
MSNTFTHPAMQAPIHASSCRPGTAVQSARRLQALGESVRAASRAGVSRLPHGLVGSVARAGDLLDALPPGALEPRGDTYVRHVAYADPQGGFTIMYLVWQPGQFSPVHGHKTWCAYRVLQGCLTETRYRWDADAGQAWPADDVERRPGDIVTAAPGLGQIHRLGNGGTEVAVSLHVYGVGEAQIAAGVNLVIATTPSSTAAG